MMNVGRLSIGRLEAADDPKLVESGDGTDPNSGAVR